MKCLYSNSFVKLDSFYDQHIEVTLSESIQGFSIKDIYIQQKAMFMISYIYQKTIVKENCSYCQQKVFFKRYSFQSFSSNYRRLVIFCCIKLHGNCSLVGDETLVERLKNSFKGSVENLFPQCSGIINFAGGIFLLGGGNLTRSDFDRSENYHLVGEMNLWWREQKFVGGGFFLVGGE